MKKKRREEELKKEIARTNDLTKQLDLISELGSLYRLDGDLEAACNSYKRAVQIAASLGNHLDLSFARRAIAEIYSEEGDRENALKHAELFRQTAQQSGSCSQIQLSLHVTGWIYEKLNILQSHDPADLEKALSWCIKSIDYIKEFGHRIDADRKAVKIGGDSARRKAGLERLCSGLCANLQRSTEAERYWNSAYLYSKRNNDVDLEYQLLLARLDFSWESPVKNAQRLVNFAPGKKKGYAIIELAQVLMLAGDFVSAQNALFECLVHHRSSLMPEDVELLDARIIFLYKYFHRLEHSKSSDCCRSERRRMYELIADSFCSYGSERKEMLEHAMNFYKMMLGESVSDKEKLSATVSVAQTFMDLKAFEEASHWFEKVLDLEKKISRPEDKLCQTRVLIFEAKCRCRDVSTTAIQNEFDLLVSQIPSGLLALKSAVYGAMGSFFSERGDQDTANMYLQRSRQFELEADNTECEEDDDCENVSDALDEKPDSEILSECMEMAYLRNSDREIEKDRDKEKNAHGETRLHIAARSSDTAMVEKLIAAGYNVNKCDHGGWTPISEAVSAGIRNNVLALLKAGANVDPVSLEALNDEENSTGGGITPLMEACEKGFVEIARDLLKYGASVVKKNADGWTAVDFLSTMSCFMNFLVSCEDEDESHVKELSILAEYMEDQQRKESFSVRGYAPQRRKLKKTQLLSNSSQVKRRELDEIVNLNSYKRIIEGLGAQSKKKDKPILPKEKSISLEDDVVVLKSPAGNDVALHDCCERQRTMGDSVMEDEGNGLSCYSPQSSLFAPFKTKVDSGSFPRNDVLDDFVVADESRRRKRGNQDSFEDSSVVVKRRSQVKRSDTDAIPGGSVKNCSLGPATRSPSNAETYIVATLRFENENGGFLRADKVVSFSRTATMSAAHDRFRAELDAHESKSFDIRLSDGREADANVPLLSLGEPLVIVCRLHKPSAEVLYKSRSAVTRDAVLKCISQFDATGVLDLSSASSDDHRFIEDILKAVADTNRPITRLVLDGCNITFGILSAVAVILPRVQVYTCKHAGFLDEHLAMLCSGPSSLSISSLDLSHNEFISGFALSTFLMSCTNLKELRICDLDITLCEDAVINSICGLHNIKLLDVSFSGFLRGRWLERLLSSCDSLVILKMNGCDLSGVPFVSTWLPNLRELSMVGCQLTEFDSLIEWISMGCVQLLDLSATNITIDHLRTLVDARLMCPPMVVRLVRCRAIECSPRMFADMILHFVDQRSFPLRFGFSPVFSNNLQAITAFASNFLCT